MRLVVRLIHGRMQQVRNSPKVVADIEARAERIAAAAGVGHSTRPLEHQSERSRRAIVTDTWDAARSEAKYRTLTRALDAGR